MSTVPASPAGYAHWRVPAFASALLREDATPGAPPEKLLQLIWLHQRIQRDRLRLADGRPVQILHPGFLNRQAGPDFRHALVQFGSDPPRQGDVEIDLLQLGWKLHGHDRNPNFENVVLQVVWTDTAPAGRPTLALAPYLDAPWPELMDWLDHAAWEVPERWQGRCAGPLRWLSAQEQTMLLREAALVRLEGKGRRMRDRSRQAGWEQSLWEELFHALGYDRNVWPMRRLAELKDALWEPGMSWIGMQARLLGAAGLLPSQLPQRSIAARRHTRRLWDSWWRDQARLQSFILPPGAWRRSGLRPSNQPERRLALAAFWWTEPGLIARLEQWSAAETSAPRQLAALLALLRPPADPIWSRHWSLRSSRSLQPRHLLGAARATDLAMNVILPWLWIRAHAGRRDAFKARIQEWYLSWPAAQDNAALKLARQRLLGSSSPRLFRQAALQQGLLQIVHDRCAASNAVCDRCEFPELVKRWQTDREGREPENQT